VLRSADRRKLTARMTLPVEYRPASAADTAVIKDFLVAAGLPADDADPARQEFLLAFSGGDLVGSAALEVRRGDALLRSVAVAPQARRHGLGDALVARVLEHARAFGVRTVWLLTTDSDAWFAKRGFTAAERAAAPPAIAATSEFRGSCPASARCMRRVLEP
jgi:amino-acid N-acetyltransferase